MSTKISRTKKVAQALACSKIPQKHQGIKIPSKDIQHLQRSFNLLARFPDEVNKNSIPVPAEVTLTTSRATRSQPITFGTLTFAQVVAGVRQSSGSGNGESKKQTAESKGQETSKAAPALVDQQEIVKESSSRVNLEMPEVKIDEAAPQLAHQQGIGSRTREIQKSAVPIENGQIVSNRMPCKTEDAESGYAKKPALPSNQLKLDNRDQSVNESSSRVDLKMPEVKSDEAAPKLAHQQGIGSCTREVQKSAVPIENGQIASDRMPCKTEDAKSGCAKKPALLSNQLKLDNRDQPVNEDDDKKIFLRNINHFMTDDALVSAFSYWGTVKSIKSFRAKPFGGFAILIFENKEAAQNCLNRSMYVAPRFAISAMEYKPRSQRHRKPKVNRSIMRDDDFPTLRRT